MMICLTALLLGCGGAAFSTGCGDEFVSTGDGGVDAGGGHAGQGGEAGTAGAGNDAGGDAGTGGTAGQGGTAGSGGEAGAGGSAGAGGQGGGGGNPCTGIYLTLDSVTGQSSLLHTLGNVTYATYLLYGTSTGNELTSFTLTNNTGGDYTTPVPTTALESMRVRCSDPNGGPSWPIACDLDISTGTANCLNPGCYSASNGVVEVQLQINPAQNQTGQIRIGINPDPQATYPINLCGDQTLLPMVTITN